MGTSRATFPSHICRCDLWRWFYDGGDDEQIHAMLGLRHHVSLSIHPGTGGWPSGNLLLHGGLWSLCHSSPQRFEHRRRHRNLTAPISFSFWNFAISEMGSTASSYLQSNQPAHTWCRLVPCGRAACSSDLPLQQVGNFHRSDCDAKAAWSHADRSSSSNTRRKEGSHEREIWLSSLPSLLSSFAENLLFLLRRQVSELISQVLQYESCGLEPAFAKSYREKK